MKIKNLNIVQETIFFNFFSSVLLVLSIYYVNIFMDCNRKDKQACVLRNLETWTGSTNILLLSLVIIK